MRFEIPLAFCENLLPTPKLNLGTPRDALNWTPFFHAALLPNLRPAFSQLIDS